MSLEHDFYFIILKQQFPRIASGVEIRWGTKDLEHYILDLINDTRNHTRQGFPDAIFQALHGILESHGNEFPHLKIVHNDPWTITYLK